MAGEADLMRAALQPGWGVLTSVAEAIHRELYDGFFEEGDYHTMQAARAAVMALRDVFADPVVRNALDAALRE